MSEIETPDDPSPRDLLDKYRRDNRHAYELLKEAQDLLEEARSWAKHGYEIGQRTATWSDQGVAPRWLIESYREPVATVPPGETCPECAAMVREPNLRAHLAWHERQRPTLGKPHPDQMARW